MAAASERTAAETTGERLAGLVRTNLIWLVLAVAVVALAGAVEQFWTPANGVNILRQVAVVGLLAIGVTLVLVAGHFDLSVGATLTLAAVVAIKMQPVDAASTAVAVLVPLGLGLVVGAINGSLVGALGANSIIVTVGMQLVLAGATLLVATGQNVRVDGASEAFVAIGGGMLLGVPAPVWLLLAVAAISHVVLANTLLGRHLKAIGGNVEAARMIAIPVARRVLTAYMISGLLAALAGVVVAARVRNLDPTSGGGYELAALTAAVLGGTRLTGGHGSVLRTLAGVLLLGVIANAMRLLDLSYSVQLLFQGLVLVTAVAIEAWLTRDHR